MKLWIDDIRPAPSGYTWIKDVWSATHAIEDSCNQARICQLEEINLDHDAGDFAVLGGDYIKILDWIEYQSNPSNYLKPMIITNKTIFKIHSMNPVGVRNMRAIIKKNNWRGN